MNQQQFFQTAKKKNIPVSVLKWIWNNKETLLSIVALLFPKAFKRESEETDCQGTPPSGPPAGSGPNGYYSCIGGEWVWIEDLG